MLQSFDNLIPIELQKYDELGFPSVFVNQNKKVHVEKNKCYMYIVQTEIIKKLLN